MGQKLFNLRRILEIFIFSPVIFYFGKRSYIAFDEGFYALQARWILEKGNWVLPLWWDEYVLDRTIGIQFLIAKSQEIFGINAFNSYLPTTISAIVMLWITYKLHEKLYSKKYAYISPLILSTTYLWFDYSHLATQDIVYSCLVTIGIFSLVNVNSQKDRFYIFLFGIWIGLAFMMKTFLVAVPLLSIFPYIFSKKSFLVRKYFWTGLIIGFLPYIFWSYSASMYLDKNIIFYLFEKFNILSNKNTFTNPFYYYFWNIPLTFLPWSIFSIIGLFCNFSENNDKKFILSFFPLTLILLISFFSTKTPYYPLQISAILSIDCFAGIQYLINSEKYKLFFIYITSRLIPLILIAITFIYHFSLRNSSNFNTRENTFVTLGLISFALSWSLISNKNKIKNIIIPLIIGPYLFTSLVLQSGLFTDRSRDLRETMEYINELDLIKNQIVKVDKSGINNSQSQSKIIRIALMTPNLGESVENISNLKSSEFAWSTKSNDLLIGDLTYEIIYENENLSPWKLIQKK